ncbi:EamA-like transporter family protein [Tsuneonella dongtanensis]|uniref:EamA-like transporter family protein n=1 Tax=Tsuneonella dongtanensis TaxID=692370 RepID=A0A1B2ACA7_9SPHN|nr:DMT family transporter [Tsuneonella dongtanensis]ANY19685.1 EamA-like transporter family protein [Tsuneonella dongtanensis]
MPRSDHPVLPLLAAVLAIGLLSWMDAFMKNASLAVGAYSALLLRAPLGFAVAFPAWRLSGGKWPARPALRIHLVRGVVVAVMGFLFFYGLTFLPLAQAIAISFVAPLIALFLAAVLLGEKIGRRVIIGALLGLVGVLVILAGKILRETMTGNAPLGIAAVLGSALLYAWNLVLQRQQALVAKPLEVVTFQSAISFLVLIWFAPFFLVWPDAGAWRDIGISTLLSYSGAMLLTWAYARAETQRLAPLEYTGFLWAVLFGWLFFGEAVSISTTAGAMLIVAGCWIATRGKPPEPEQTAL